MFIRLFTTVETQKEALSFFDDLLSPITQYILSKDMVKVEPYWKIEGNFVVEAAIGFNEIFRDYELRQFLDGISDFWQFFGEPIDEALSSRNMTSNLKDGVNLINILFEGKRLLEQ